MTFVPWEAAASVEDALHANRWTATDADATAYLANVGALQQRFLGHGETQGEVLEGFVLVALDVPVDALAPLIAAYEAAVAPTREAALVAARQMGEACRAREAWLVTQLDGGCGGREPRRLEGLHVGACWDMACAGDARDPVCVTFRTLRELYGHRVALKPYDYCGQLQMQIDVGDDQVFFGWGLHAALGGAAPLYRGMVVQFDGMHPPPVEAALASAAEATAGEGERAACPVPGARVVAIAKLKCLNYLVRTFGVRNLLPTLLDRGAPAYLAATERFYKNWGVPTEHHSRLGAHFSDWAREVSGLPEMDKRLLRGGEYLWLLEPLLRGERRGGTASFGLDRFLLLLVNLTGAPLPGGTLSEYAPGMLPIAPQDHHSGAHLVRTGCVLMLEIPPSGRLLAAGSSTPTLVLIFPPAPQAAVKWQKMWQACAAIEGRHPHLAGRVLIQPPASEWRAVVASLVTALPPPPPSYSIHQTHAHRAAATADELVGGNVVGGLPGLAGASAAVAGTGCATGASPMSAPNLRSVVVILALPPGGGKSSLYAALRANGAAVVSSDEERARNGNFDVVLGQVLQSHRLVCYDKNVPDANGLTKLCRVLGTIERQQRLAIRVVVVAPATLRHNVAWQRVLERPPTDIALNVHTCDGGANGAYRIFKGVFFDACVKFLPTAQSLPNAVTSDAFWEGGPLPQAAPPQPHSSCTVQPPRAQAPPAPMQPNLCPSLHTAATPPTACAICLSCMQGLKPRRSSGRGFWPRSPKGARVRL